MKTTITLVIVLISMVMESAAIITRGSGDPNNNTNVPPEMANQIAKYGPVTAELLNSNTVIIAKHAFYESYPVVYRGIDYQVAGWTNIAFDLTLLRIAGTFPADAKFCRLNTGNVIGMNATIVGRGYTRGREVSWPHTNTVVVTNEFVTTPGAALITNFVHGLTVDEFDVVCDETNRFVVQKATDFMNWTNSAEQEASHVTIPATDLNCFYRVITLAQTISTVITNTVTNKVVVGWEAGEYDGVLRWGRNKVEGIEGDLIFFTFDDNDDPNEGAVFPGDSSGPAFNDAGELIGVAYGARLGPFSQDGVSFFLADMMDMSGLGLGSLDWSSGEPTYVEYWRLGWSEVVPGKFFYSPIPPETPNIVNNPNWSQADPLFFSATSGVVTAPFVSTNGYIYQTVETTLANSGWAAYNFTIVNAGAYVIQTMVSALDGGENSFYVNIDAEPQDPYMIWDIPLTVGFEQRTLSWRGDGTTPGEFVPKVFNLTPGTHQLIIRGREGNTRLQSITILPYGNG